VPETTTSPKPLVPVVDVVIVVVQLNSILNPCEFVLLLFYAQHLVNVSMFLKKVKKLANEAYI
jgi:hypothetical protein